MEASKLPTKTSSLKALILKAWRERWTDIQWGINIKTILPRGVSGDLYNLADCLLQQAMVGCGANELVMSYLKHSLASQLVSYAAVIHRISKFDEFHKPHCLMSLLEFLESFLDGVSCLSKMEEELIASAVSALILWLLQVYHYSLSKYQSTNPIQSQELLEKTTTILNTIVNNDFLLALFFLAKCNNPDEYNEITNKCQEITALMMMNTQFKAPLTIHDALQKICSMDIDKVAPLNNKPDVIAHCIHSFIVVNVFSSASAEISHLSSQLLMLKRIKGYSLSRLYFELIKACFISLNDASKDASKQALWAAFTFLKVPQVINYIHNTSNTTNKEGDFSIELVDAFEKLLRASPLLDIVDSKNSCNCITAMIEPLIKLNILTDSHLTYFNQKRDNKDLKLQKLEPTGLQGSVPLFITRAEPTLAGILKTMGGDFHKTQESLYVMLCQIVSGTTLDTILAVAVVEGKLKLFVSRLIKFNEFALMAANEKGTSQSRTCIFDISFLILCIIVQEYGADTVLGDNEDSFFEQWVKDCMPQQGNYKSPDYILKKSDPQIYEIFLHHLSTPDFDFKNTNLRPQDLCTNVSAVTKDILYAWEIGSLNLSEVKRMLDSMRQKMASLAVCASVWLFSYNNVAHRDATIKPNIMVQQFLCPPSEAELSLNDNFKERTTLMTQIIKNMQFDIEPKSKVSDSKTESYIPVIRQLQDIWDEIISKGYLHIDLVPLIDKLYNTAGPNWFANSLLQQVLSMRYQKELERAIDIVLAMFHIDIEQCGNAFLSHVLPEFLFNVQLFEKAMEPQSAFLAKITVYTIYSLLEHSVINKEGSRKRRHDNDEIDMPFGSKMRRLNDSTSENRNKYYSQTYNTSGITLLESVLNSIEILFKSFSQLVDKSGDVTAQTFFIYQFLVYIVQCGEERAQLILQKMPNDLIPTLIKALPDNFNTSLILRLNDLSTLHGRKDTARDLCLFRNMKLRPD